MNFVSYGCDITAHAETSTSDVVYLITCDLELNGSVRGLESLGTNNEHAAAPLVRWNLELALESLHSCAHDVAKRCLDRANQVEGALTVIVDDFESQLLSLFKGVTHDDVGLEIRVQVIQHSLGLGSHPPLVDLRNELVDAHLGVRLTEHVQVLELSARDEKLYLHRKIVL